MRRFFVSPEALADEEVRLTGDVLHHVGQVLRLEAGEEILLLDGEGTTCHCRLISVGRNAAQARVLKRYGEEERVLPIRLLQGIPKGDKMDLVLQKGTELGVSTFAPVLTGRSVSRPDGNREQKRRQRWERIVREAARQSARSRLPEILASRPLAEAMSDCREELRLLLWEEGSRPLSAVLTESPPRDAAILIGPEGGITAEEAETAFRFGFVPVRLGPRILRTETAGFAVSAILQYLYGDLSGGEDGCPDPRASAGGRR